MTKYFVLENGENVIYKGMNNVQCTFPLDFFVQYDFFPVGGFYFPRYFIFNDFYGFVERLQDEIHLFLKGIFGEK